MCTNKTPIVRVDVVQNDSNLLNNIALRRQSLIDTKRVFPCVIVWEKNNVTEREMENGCQ